MVATSRPHSETAARIREDAAGLRREAVRFADYLLGVVPSADLVERYVRAHDRVLVEPLTEGDEAVLGFVQRHHWSLGLLDAGTAFVGTAPRLRQKLVVMMAILEATPQFVEQTMPVDGIGVPRLVWRLGVAGARAGLKLVAGTALAAVVTR